MRFDCIHCRKATTKPQSVKGAFLRMLTFQYTVHVECEQNLSNKIQQIIMNVLSFDRNVKLNALFHKTSGKKAIVYCDMEMQGEHKVLLDLLVSRLRSQDGVFSAGWEKKNLPQEDF